MTDELAATLVRASYEGVAFPVAVAPWEGGHDGVDHTGWRRPGVDTEWTGVKADRGTLKIPFLASLRGYGTLYPDVFAQFLALLKAVPKGRLTHPVLGTFPAFLGVWKATPDADVRNGLWLEVAWVEQNAEALLQLADPAAGATDGDATAQAVTQAAAADAALTAVGVGPPTLQALYLAQVALLRAGPLGYLALASAFGVLVAATEAALALPPLLAWTPTTALAVHAAVAALEALRATTYRLRAQYLPNLARLRTYVTPRAMTAAEVAWAVYQDLGKAAVVRAANGVLDATIPAGTTLTILPT